ncbi:MAG: mechanosensitive ion channel [Coriobacteriia bacterium]|nr:mechanosensitive ion channel [Coriobacteriia bacterium]
MAATEQSAEETASNAAQQLDQTTQVLDPFAQVQNLLQSFRSLVGDDLMASLLTAFVVLVITSFVAHAVTKFLKRVLAHKESALAQSSLMVNIGRFVVWFLGLSVVLATCFDVDVSALLAALGVGGLAISLGAQDTVSNMIGGLQMTLMGTVHPGDHIEMGGSRGVVQDVSWRHVTLTTPTGGTIIIPNQVINKNTFTRLPDVEKVVVPIGVDKNACDLDMYAKVVEAAVADSVAKVATVDVPPVVLFDAITEFGYTGNVVLWTSEEADSLKVKDAVVRAIAPFTVDDFMTEEAEAAADAVIEAATADDAAAEPAPRA